MGDPPLNVTPLIGEFNDVEVSLTYVVPFTIHNVGRKVKTLRFVPPKSPSFRLGKTPYSIAPGLHTIVEVEFATNVQQDLHDEWKIVTEDGTVTIPLHAWFPCANLQFDTFLQIGTTLLQHNISKDLRFKNIGKKGTRVKFSISPQTPGFSITPKTLTVDAESSAEAKLNFFGADLGPTSTQITVEIEGKEPKTIDVTANVVEAKLDVINMDGTPCDTVNFGTLYFGQTKTYSVKVVNNSPFVASVNITNADSSDTGGPGEEPTEEFVPIICLPSEGRVPKFSSLTLQFTFQPVPRERLKGFQRTAKTARELAEEWKAVFNIDMLETEHRVELPVKGKAVIPDVGFSDTVFRFGSCKVNEHVDILLTVVNNGSELPAVLEFERIAHFNVKPAKLTLQPKQECNVVMSFSPHQLGTFSSTATCWISGIKKVPLTVTGTAEEVGKKRPVIGGIDKVGEDFVRPPNYTLNGTRSQSRRAGTKAGYDSTLDDTRKAVTGTTMGTSVTIDETVYLSEFEQRREHNRLYREYLDSSKANREILKSLTQNSNWDYYNPKPVDLGMIPGEGLRPPEPILPLKEDRLFGATGGSQDGQANANATAPRRRHKFDDTKLTKKKFKPAPTTLNEQRECKVSLSPKELSSVAVGPKILDFGQVSIFSKCVKNLTVCNDLKTSVLVKIPTNMREELKDSFPEAQVIPPDGIAGFDIVFRATTVQTFQQAVYLSLNDHHKLKFVVFAEVVPIEVSLSEEEMIFRFSEFMLDSTLTHTATLTNHGNSEAEFTWEHESQEGAVNSFTLMPMKGSIPPKGAVYCDVTYNPGSTNQSIQVMTLQVVGGPPKKLTLNGMVNEAKLTFLDKKLEFGMIPVGTSVVKTVSLKNIGGTAAVFFMETLVQGLSVQPLRGRVAAGATQEITVTFRPTQPQVVNSNLICHVRGGKLLKLPVKGDAKIPVVTLQVDERLTFEDVFVGGTAMKPLCLKNVGNEILAILTLDLTNHPYFSIADERRRQIEASVGEDQKAEHADGLISLIEEEDDASQGSDDHEEMHSNGRAESECSTPRDAKGSKYKFTVNSDGKLPFFLVYKPAGVESLEFNIPFMLAGVVHPDPTLIQQVKANSLKPRLALSQSVVDFGNRVVVREGTAKSQNRITLKLTNEDETPLQWEITCDPNTDNFRIEPLFGKLNPGQGTSVTVSFTPLQVQKYEEAFPVVLDGARDQRYTEIILKGRGCNPSLTFDPPEVILPVVPLDVPSRAIVYITNEGYEALDLKYKMPLAAEGNRIPLSVSFPEGSTLTQTTPTLPVELVFAGRKSMSFTTFIEFTDDEGSKFVLPTSGTCDCCMLTVYPHLYNTSGYTIMADSDKKPIMYSDEAEVQKARPSSKSKEKEKEKDKDDRPESPRSEIGRQSIAMTESDTASTTSTFDRLLRKTYAKRHSDRLKNWLNMNLLQDPIEDLVQGLSSNNGRPFLLLIEQLYGRMPPGRVTADEINKAPSKKDVSFILLRQYDEILAFLKGFGALLAEVRPQFLLKYEDFVRVETSEPTVPIPAEVANARRPSSTGNSIHSGSSTGAPKKAGKVLSERRFQIRTTHAWMSVIYQCVKVFYLDRINWKSFRQQPMTERMQEVALEEKWATANQDLSVQGSNCYSIAESLLLKWLTIHVSPTIFTLQQPQAQQTRPNRQQVPTRPGSRVLNFDSDLKDGKVFCALLQSYIPHLAKRFHPAMEGGFILQPQDAVDCEHNLTIIHNAMKEVGILSCLSVKEMLDANPRDMLLFVLQLYNTLPLYIPKSTIMLIGHLHQPIVKTLELTNPSKYALDYIVHLDGCEEFKLFDTKFRLEANSSGKFPITITPRFSKAQHARVTFVSQRVNSVCGTIVFNLKTQVDREGTCTVINVSTPLYEAYYYELEVPNPFPVNGHFTITYTQQRAPPEPNEPKYPELASIQSLPEPFWTGTDSMNIKKNEKGKLTMQFLPFVRGKYKCELVLFDEKAGEFVFQFFATATNPIPYDKVVVQTEAAQGVTKEAALPWKNIALEKALSVVQDRFKQFKGRDKRTAVGLEENGKYSLECGSTFWAMPKEVSTDTKKDDKDKDKDKDKEKEREKNDGPKQRTPRGQLKEATQFQLQFNPKGPGQYPAVIVMSSAVDVRVLEVDGKARMPGVKAELEFCCPARQTLNQEIPITNKSDKDWVITAQLNGEYFSGPREIRVPPGKAKSYQLLFSPAWICDVTGQLILRNSETQEKYLYTLRGKSEEPLSEAVVDVECHARQKYQLELNVPNITADDVTYSIESDLAFLQGSTSFHVQKLETGVYQCVLCPTLGGKYTGSVQFTAPSGHYVWFVINANVLRPPPEAVIQISAEVRKAAVCAISMSNPSDEPLSFDVRRKGEGLIGDDIISLHARETDAYNLIFSPLRPGKWKSSVSFFNDEVGEYWYELHLTALEAQPVILDEIHCELGKTAQLKVVVENPVDEEVHLLVTTTNDTNFAVSPSPVILPPLGDATMTIVYMPSTISQPQTVNITLFHQAMGKWEYTVTGVGHEPTIMEQVTVSCPVGRSNSTSVVFRNPFPHTKRFIVKLKYDGDGEFQLVLKKYQHTLGAFGVLQVPITYKPVGIQENTSMLIVSLIDEQQEQGLDWKYPIIGIAEAQTAGEAGYRFTCAARGELMLVAAFPIVQYVGNLQAEEFTHTVDFPSDLQYRSAVLASFRIERATFDEYKGQYKNDKEKAASVDPALVATHVFYSIVFVPLRPFSTTADLLLRRKNGGLWRFELSLEATPPPPDDVIMIESPIDKTEAVSFHLTNIFPRSDDFVAYFTSDSPIEFTVVPTKGILMPADSSPLGLGRPSGTQFVVSFTSSMYGKQMVGYLIIETQEMQWRYEVKGSIPKYKVPVVSGSRLDNKLSAETESRLRASNKRRSKK